MADSKLLCEISTPENQTFHIYALINKQSLVNLQLIPTRDNQFVNPSVDMNEPIFLFEHIVLTSSTYINGQCQSAYMKHSVNK